MSRHEFTADGSRRRPVVAGVVLALLVGIVASVAVARFVAASAEADRTPVAAAPTVSTGESYGGDPVREARLVRSEAQRLVYVRTVSASARWNAAVADDPYRVRTGPTFTLVLPARAEPYTVADLERLAPDTFVKQPDGGYLLSEHVLVLTGATLALAPPPGAAPGSAGLSIRLKSDAQSFVSIVTSGGSLRVDGTAQAPVAITSWDGTAAAPDADTSDGRAYLRVIGGQASFSHASFSELGFWSGNTGGLALTGTEAAATFDAFTGNQADPTAAVSGAQVLPPGTPVTPAAESEYTFVSAGLDHVTLVGNAFGLFVTSAEGVVIRDSSISRSLVDGLVFHRFVTDSSITRTTSFANAVDGFRLSRSSAGVTLRDVTASDNGRDGLSLDGRPLAAGPSATGTAVEKFGDNRVTGGVFRDNERYGISVSGGRDVVLADNHVVGNQSGIVVNHEADGVAVVGNRLERQAQQSISIRDAVVEADVSENTVSGGDTAIYVRNSEARVADNTVRAVSNHGVTLMGDTRGSTVVDNTIAGFGAIPVYTERATGGVVRANDTLDWRKAASAETVVNAIFQPLTLVWIVLAVLVLASALSPSARRAREIRHPYADRAPLSEFTRGVVSRDSMKEPS